MRLRDLADLLVVIGVAITAAGSPLIEGLPWGHDTPLHLFRLQALDQHLREGYLYPRWFGNFVFGYGYPVLHFYAPLTYYLGEVFHLLGLSLTDAFKAVPLAARCIGGVGTYFFARSVLGTRVSGLVAGAAFLLVSYQYTLLFERVAIPELLAFNLVPVALLATERVIHRPSGENTAVIAIALALLILAHQATLIPSAAVVAAYAAFRLVQRPVRERQTSGVISAAIALTAGVFLAIGMSAFYWLPAMIDRISVPLAVCRRE